MFGFFKSACHDGDLFGYIVQAAGGALNLVNEHKVGQFSKERIIQLVNVSLDQRRRKIDIRQERLVNFAAEIIEQQIGIGTQTDVSKHVQSFAKMMMRGGVNFHDPSVNLFKDQLARYGCVFNI